jgi:hypothetical protein
MLAISKLALISSEQTRNWRRSEGHIIDVSEASSNATSRELKGAVRSPWEFKHASCE